MLTNPGLVERHLGQTFTAMQVAECHAVCMAASAWMKAEYGLDDTAGPVTENRYDLGPVIWLSRRPITSVTSVSLRSGISATPTALTVGVDYEIADATTGAISIPGYRWGWPRNYGYDMATIVYTPSVTVPANVELAATMLAAHWLRRHTEGISPGIKSYSISGELSVTFGDAVSTYGVPVEVTGLLTPYARMAFA